MDLLIWILRFDSDVIQLMECTCSVILHLFPSVMIKTVQKMSLSAASTFSDVSSITILNACSVL